MDNSLGQVVILGATGTLGTYLLDELVEQGYEVYACARRYIDHPRFSRDGVHSVAVDVVSGAGFERLPHSGVRAVVHIAGAMPSRMKGYKPSTYIDVNVSGTLRVLDYCRTVGAQVLVYMQSHSDVAGWWNSEAPIPADAPRRLNLRGDHAVYIISKNAAVDLCLHYAQEYALRTVVLRLPTIYAYTPIAEMYVNGIKRPIAYLYLMQRAAKGEPIEVWGNPKIVKDIVYVKDYTQIVRRAIESANAQGIYNVGTGVGISLQTQIEGIVQVFSPPGRPSPLVYLPDKPSQIGYIYDVSKTRQDLGYEPRFPYIEALKDMKRESQGDRFRHLDQGDLSI
jgi:UDP-glucose 4-epimerase